MVKIKEGIQTGRAHKNIKFDYEKDKLSGLKEIHGFICLDGSVSEAVEKKND